MKNVLIIASDNNTSSGAFRSMVKMCQLIMERGKYFPIVVLPKKGDGYKLLDATNIPWHYVRSYSWVQSLDEVGTLKGKASIMIKRILNTLSQKKIAAIAKNENVVGIHINSIWSYVGAYAAFVVGIPLVWHIREALDADQNKCLYSPKCYELINKADVVIAVSDYISRCYGSRINRSKMVTIYNGIDRGEFYYDKKREKRKFIEFLSVANMNSKKGQEYIIKAGLALISKGISTFHVSFVGDGRNREKLERIVESKDAGKYFAFYGQQDNVTKYYQQADVFIMSSDAEAFGRVPVEAMLMGCLVIGSNSGATPEILQNGEYGILYEKSNVSDLEKKMNEVIQNYDRYTDLARKGQRHAVNEFTAQRNAMKVEKMYDTYFCKSGA